MTKAPAVMPHVITGDREQVRAALARTYELGRLVSVGEAQLLPGDRVRVVAAIRSRSTRWEQVRPWLVGALKVAGALAVIAAAAGAVWAVVSLVLAIVALVAAVVAWVHAHLALILLVGALLVGLIVAALDGGHGCAGLHCGGCRR